MTEPSRNHRSIAVIGAGLVGRSWAIGFARAGWRVALYDADHRTTEQATRDIDRVLAELDALALPGLAAAEARRLVQPATSLAEAVRGAIHVQENAPERVELKRALFADLDALAESDAVLASSTSALLPSSFVTGLAGAARCLVAHPLNPPHLIPAVEIVPAPATAPETIARTRALLTAIGQRPIAASREIEGFIMNRLQGAILDEAFMLVDAGIASVEDIDTAMRDGLARRWSFMGPFETIDLNAPGGIATFIQRYGPAYESIGRARPDRPDWRGSLAEAVISARRHSLPIDDLPERQNWRDRELAALAGHFAARRIREV